jgi:hypothetical protein
LPLPSTQRSTNPGDGLMAGKRSPSGFKSVCHNLAEAFPVPFCLSASKWAAVPMLFLAPNRLHLQLSPVPYHVSFSIEDIGHDTFKGGSDKRKLACS